MAILQEIIQLYLINLNLLNINNSMKEETLSRSMAERKRPICQGPVSNQNYNTRNNRKCLNEYELKL